MIFHLNYTLLTIGHNGILPLIGGYLKVYAGASDLEIGVLLTSILLLALVLKPLFCSLADCHQAYRLYLVLSLTLATLSYSTFLITPFFPRLYAEKPRLAWYLFLVSCVVGNGAISVAWSLSDSLAVNMAHKRGFSFGRMRMCGTISLCLYGLFVGRLEVPFLPEFVPAFCIILLCLFTDAIILALWKEEDFEMVELIELPNEVDLKSYGVSADGGESSNTTKVKTEVAPTSGKASVEKSETVSTELPQTNDRNVKVQYIIFKLILDTDGRLIKYMILITLIGIMLAPINFIALSLNEVCDERGCEFSQLEGLVIANQGLSESASFLVSPWILPHFSRTSLLAFSMLTLFARYFFYANFYYTADISPYWMLASEWGYGLPYGIIVSMVVDLALMFAERSKLFIVELRKRGILSEPVPGTERIIEREEHKVKMLLRASMQGLFGGLMDGFGRGSGSLVSGVLIGAISYAELWQLFAVFTFTVLIIHQLLEMFRLRWSDSYNLRIAELSG